MRDNSTFLVILAILISIFFFEVLFLGKVYVSPDGQSTSILVNSIKNEDIFPQWMPYIFSGMPATLIYEPNFVYLPNVVLHLLSGIVSHLLHYLLAGFGVFLLLRYLGGGLIAGLVGSVAFIFTPNMVAQEIYGHGGLHMTAAYIPWAFLFTLKTLKDSKNAWILALILGLQLQRGHIQIAYYTWILCGFWYIWNYRQVTTKKVVVPLLAIGIAALKIFPMFTYQQDSIRNNLSYSYASNWSLHPKEIATFIFPDSFGFGGTTYTGYLPFTDYPNFLGIGVLILAIVAFMGNRTKLHWFLLSVIGLSILISFGKWFPLHGLLFDYLPLFDRFRVPIMILMLTQFSFAVLAGLGVQKIKTDWFAWAVALIVLLDLWRVDYRINKPVEKYIPTKDRAIEFLEADNDIFRVWPLGRLFNSNDFARYRIESIGGYNSAKLSSYQRFINTMPNENLINLNVKYAISEKPLKHIYPMFKGDELFIYRYSHYKPRYHLEGGNVKVVKKRTADVILDIEANKEQLLFISEIWHKNWRASIDGEDVEVQKYKGLTCAIKMPFGKHVVKFEYRDWAPSIGMFITILSFGILIIGIRKNGA